MIVLSQDWVFWSQDRVPNYPGHSMGCQKACLRCYKSEQHDGCGSQQEPSVLLRVSQNRPTLLACLEELRSRIKQKHGGDCEKAAETLESADETAQAFESAHMTSRAAQGLLACAPSAPDAMMRLRNSTLCAAAANKVALEAEQQKDAAEKGSAGP